MNSIHKIIKNNIPSVVFLVLFVFLGGVLLSMISKGDVVIWLNERHSKGGDYFMMFFNLTAEWVWVLSIVFLVLKPYWGIVTSAIFAVNGLLVQFFKIVVFNYPRPFAYLKDVEAVVCFDMEMGTKFSFPSGHTNAMFVAAMVLGLLSGNRTVLFLGMITGLLTGISRIYFFQHFFMDIYAGAILAILLSTVMFVLFENSQLNTPKFHKPFWKKS